MSREHFGSPFGLLQLRAYHEAGHAVVAFLKGFTLTAVTIARHGDVGGTCEYAFVIRRLRNEPRGRSGERPPSLRRAARAAAAVDVAGSIAQDEATLRRGYVALDTKTGLPLPLFAPGSEADEKAALRVAGWLYPGADERRAFLRRIRTGTQRLLARPENWAAVEGLAALLVRARTVGGNRATERIRRTIDRSVSRKKGAGGRRAPGRARAP